MNILSMTYEQVATEMTSVYGKGAFHAAALYREIYKKGNRSFAAAPEFAASQALAKKLTANLVVPSVRIAASHHDERGVIKFATALHDGNVVETVIIPAARRITLCVSSQVGCNRGCAMCLTGTMGFVRDLLPEEITMQIFAARFKFNQPVDNVVFMGMGEPLDNFDNVMQAVKVLSDQRGFAIPLRAITISTAGNVAGIKKLAVLNLPHIRFAVSINAPNDALRTMLMPINKKYPLAVLKEALRKLPVSNDGVIFIEYVLLAGINDSPEMAEKLAEYLEGLKVRINVIAYNESAMLGFVAPTPLQVRAFCDCLVKRKLFVRIRQSFGKGIGAACGQLRSEL